MSEMDALLARIDRLESLDAIRQLPAKYSLALDMRGAEHGDLHLRDRQRVRLIGRQLGGKAGCRTGHGNRGGGDG